MRSLRSAVLVGLLTIASCSGGGSSATEASACAAKVPCLLADAGVEHLALQRAGANGLAVDPKSGRVYVAINGATQPWCGDKGQFTQGLSIIDPAQGKELAVVATAESPVWPLVDTARNRVYVAGSGGRGTVAVHDPATGALTASIELGGRPHDLGLDPKSATMLVSNTNDKSQTYVSLADVKRRTVTATFQVPELPHKVVVDDEHRRGYVVSLGSGTITEFDLANGTQLRTISSGPIPQTSAMVYSPKRQHLYVAKTAGSTPAGGTTIVAIDLAKGTIDREMGTFTPTESTPTRAWGGFGLDDKRGLLYAAVANSNKIAVIDVDRLETLALFEVAACPWAVALDTARGKGYVSSNATAELTVFDLTKVARAVGR